MLVKIIREQFDKILQRNRIDSVIILDYDARKAGRNSRN